MRLNDLKDLYVHELKDLYNAETRLMDALPRMAERAADAKLRDSFHAHLEETKRQRERLEQIFSDLGDEAGGEKCEAMDGLIQEAEEIMRAEGDPATIDAGLIAMANRIEHYEMAGYGAARTHAGELGFDDHAAILQKSLTEEGNADKLLKERAKANNPAAC